MASNEVTAFLFTVHHQFWSKKPVFSPTLSDFFPLYIEFLKARKQQAQEATSAVLRKNLPSSKIISFLLQITLGVM